jgi:plastocyanin
MACNSTNGVPSCVQGSCDIACFPDYGDCDRRADTGCECALVNGCDPSTAGDLTGQTSVTVVFASHYYQPRCFLVSAGTEVVFDGNFQAHPLGGGTVENGVGTLDPSSPIVNTTGGDSASFTLTDAGTYPFYCTTHSEHGMFGAVFVVP